MQSGQELSIIASGTQKEPTLTEREFNYARNLATAIWEKYYKNEFPDWKPADTTIVLLMQIDNMTVALVKEQSEKELTLENIERIYRDSTGIRLTKENDVFQYLNREGNIRFARAIEAKVRNKTK